MQALFSGKFESNVCVVCAIDNHKVFHYKKFHGYLNTERYIEFLNELGGKMDKNSKYCLFYDGLSVHKTERAVQYIERTLGCSHILNVAYQSEDNAIEYFFS